MDTSEIVGIITGLAGCFVGLAGWMKSREDKIDINGVWKGTVDTKLDDIKNSVSDISSRMSKMEGIVSTHENRLTTHEGRLSAQDDRITVLEEFTGIKK